jgi:hypothetical protein
MKKVILAAALLASTTVFAGKAPAPTVGFASSPSNINAALVAATTGGNTVTAANSTALASLPPVSATTLSSIRSAPGVSTNAAGQTVVPATVAGKTVLITFDNNGKVVSVEKI